MVRAVLCFGNRSVTNEGLVRECCDELVWIYLVAKSDELHTNSRVAGGLVAEASSDGSGIRCAEKRTVTAGRRRRRRESVFREYSQRMVRAWRVAAEVQEDGLEA